VPPKLQKAAIRLDFLKGELCPISIGAITSDIIIGAKVPPRAFLRQSRPFVCA
jgi:hypothetical protein